MSHERTNHVGLYRRGLIGLILGFLVGALLSENAVCNAAIKAGVAHWEANHSTGDTRFVWHTETKD